jgi:hypothetical protein
MTTMTTNTTTRLDRVIASQRRLSFLNVAATVALMASFGASIMAML